MALELTRGVPKMVALSAPKDRPLGRLGSMPHSRMSEPELTTVRGSMEVPRVSTSTLVDAERLGRDPVM